MLRNGKVEGVIVLARDEPGPFSPRVIELVQTFADQAVIAIENVRLFDEVQEALQRETATSEILRVIAGSPSDTKPVFDSICFTAVRSLRCDGAFVLMRDGDVFIHSAGATPQGPMTDLAPDRVPINPDANFPSRAILAKETLYLPDWSQIDLPEHERNIHAAFGVCSALYLPLLRKGECIGVIAVVGSRPNAFGLKEIAQAESFRDQAVIAIENARLFDEV
jgi:GAF domain-containing protein